MRDSEWHGDEPYIVGIMDDLTYAENEIKRCKRNVRALHEIYETLPNGIPDVEATARAYVAVTMRNIANSF